MRILKFEIRVTSSSGVHFAVQQPALPNSVRREITVTELDTTT